MATMAKNEVKTENGSDEQNGHEPVAEAKADVVAPIKTDMEAPIKTDMEAPIKTDMEANTEPDSSVEPLSAEVKKKILQQMEYYFGDYNLPRDKFLKEQLQKDDGWITMVTMLNFRRLASLSTDGSAILDAIETSKLLQIDETRTKVRRSPEIPLPETEGDLRAESLPRTVYVKGFPKDSSVDLDVLLEYFSEHGPIETIHMRNFHDHIKNVSGFKGSVLVVFPTRVLAEAFLQKFDLKYKSTPLLRMWHADYIEEKKKEIEERIKRKEERKQFVQNEKDEIDISLPKGTYLHMSDIPAGTSREDIKAALVEHTTDFAFIGYSKEQVEGYLRFKTEGCNVHLLSVLQGKFKVKDTEIKLRIVEGEEEEDQLQKASEARLNSKISRPTKRNFRGGRGGYRGPPNKRRRFK